MSPTQAEVAEEAVETNEVANEETLLESAVGQAFVEGFDNNKTDNEIKLDMIQAGASFSSVTRQFNQLMIDTGRAMAKKDRDEIVNSTLIDCEGLETEEGFDGAVESLIDQITGATEKSAAALIRSWAKRNEVEVYKKPKGVAKVGFASKFYDALRSNPEMTADEATAFINGEDGHEATSDNVKKHMSHYQAIRALVNDIAAA